MCQILVRSLAVNQYTESRFDMFVYNVVDYCATYGMKMGAAEVPCKALLGSRYSSRGSSRSHTYTIEPNTPTSSMIGGIWFTELASTYDAPAPQS